MHSLARGGAEGEEISLDALTRRRRAAAVDASHVHRAQVRRGLFDDAVREVLGPLEVGVPVNEADVERMDDEGKAIDVLLFCLEIADRRLPGDLGHEVEVGVP